MIDAFYFGFIGEKINANFFLIWTHYLDKDLATSNKRPLGFDVSAISQESLDNDIIQMDARTENKSMSSPKSSSSQQQQQQQQRQTTGSSPSPSSCINQVPDDIDPDGFETPERIVEFKEYMKYLAIKAGEARPRNVKRRKINAPWEILGTFGTFGTFGTSQITK